jgi:hypothetical protein
MNDQRVLTNLRANPFGPIVMLPESTNIQATHLGQLPFHPSLSKKAKITHILDGITTSSLVSIGQLCDDNCIAVMDTRQPKVFKNNECILKGARNTTDGIWDISIPITSCQTASLVPNSAITSQNPRLSNI